MDESCNTLCQTKLDDADILEGLETIDTMLRKSLENDLAKGRIDATMLADIWTKLMGTAISSVIGAVASIQAKETAMDRCVKTADCSLKKAQEELTDEQKAEIGRESGRRDCTTTTQTDEIKVESSRRNLATEVDSILKKVQATEILVESDRKEKLTEAEHAIKVAQAAKVDYEKTYILPASVALTKRQICGFDDNINIKVMESKWSYNAMITASGMGGTGGTYQPVDDIPMSCDLTLGTCTSPCTPDLNLDEADDITLPTATPDSVTTPVCPGI